MSICSDVPVHARRIFMWRLNQVEPTTRETKEMDKASVSSENSVLRAFLAWRHSNMLVAIPITVFATISDLVVLGKHYEEATVNMNALGKIVRLVPSIASFVLLFAVFASTMVWSNWRRTRLLVKVGWSLSFVLPFVPALFPIEWLINNDATRYYNYNETELVASKIMLAIFYVLTVLPLVVTFPGGAVRAAIRIRGLLPESSLSSWILVISAPFYSLLILMSLVVVIQLAGDAVLVIGASLLTLSPWTYVVFRQLYVSSLSENEEKKLDRVQRGAGLSNLAAYILVFVWALLTDVIRDFGITYWSVITLVLRGFGNGLVSSIVFCDAFFRMTVTNWKTDKAKRIQDEGGDIDRMFGAIEGSICKSSSILRAASSSIIGSSSFLDGNESPKPEARPSTLDIECVVDAATNLQHDEDSSAVVSRTETLPHKTVVRRTILNADGSKTIIVEETVHTTQNG